MNINTLLFEQKNIDDEEMLPFVAIADDEEPQKTENFGDVLPVMALKNTVLFPGVILPITVGRDKSMRSINKANQNNSKIAILTHI